MNDRALSYQCPSLHLYGDHREFSDSRCEHENVDFRNWDTNESRNEKFVFLTCFRAINFQPSVTRKMLLLTRRENGEHCALKRKGYIP